MKLRLLLGSPPQHLRDSDARYGRILAASASFIATVHRKWSMHSGSLEALRLFSRPRPCLVLSNTRRGWANVPRWGERQRRWLAALLPLP
jgi:hypothetical protein